MRKVALAAVFLVATLSLPFTGMRAAAVSGAAPLKAQIDQLAQAFPGGAAIWVGDPGLKDPIYTRDIDREIITASLYKLAVLLEAEHQVDIGKLSYTDTITIDQDDITEDGSFEGPGTEMTIDEALEAMITISDNGTALHLWRMLGPANINAYLQKSGIAGFHVALDDEEDNYATARGIGTYFTLLANKKLVSPAASDRMLKRLGRQEINDRIPSQLPEGTVIAHKTGNLAGVVHDAGILFTPHGQRVLVAMTWDADDESANDFIAHLASTVYSSVQASPAAPHYRVPPDPQYVEVGTAIALPVTIDNAGDEPWMASGDRGIGLVWELRDGANAVIGRSQKPLSLGFVPPGASVSLPVVVTAPNRAGDAKLVLGLADAAARPLASVGVATVTVPIRVHLPFVAEGNVHIPSTLYRHEASMIWVDWNAVAPVRSEDHVLSLGWRLIDPTTSRIVATGIQALGTMKTYQRSGTFFAPLVAPNVRGTYTLEYELRERGFIAGETQQQAVTVEAPRTYGDEAGPPPSLIRPRATPSPRPTARP
jgi:beta-lactamase class A